MKSLSPRFPHPPIPGKEPRDKLPPLLEAALLMRPSHIQAAASLAKSLPRWCAPSLFWGCACKPHQHHICQKLPRQHSKCLPMSKTPGNAVLLLALAVPLVCVLLVVIPDCFWDPVLGHVIMSEVDSLLFLPGKGWMPG